jgi:hypothetical protein
MRGKLPEQCLRSPGDDFRLSGLHLSANCVIVVKRPCLTNAFGYGLTRSGAHGRSAVTAGPSGTGGGFVRSACARTRYRLFVPTRRQPPQMLRKFIIIHNLLYHLPFDLRDFSIPQRIIFQYNRGSRSKCFPGTFGTQGSAGGQLGNPISHKDRKVSLFLAIYSYLDQIQGFRHPDLELWLHQCYSSRSRCSPGL